MTNGHHPADAQMIPQVVPLFKKTRNLPELLENGKRTGNKGVKYEEIKGYLIILSHIFLFIPQSSWL
jgi:hypothetical protein